MHKPAVVFALALAVALAGCIDMDAMFPHAGEAEAPTENPTRPPSEETPPEVPPTSPPAPSPPPAVNREPTAVLTVDNLTGMAPLNLTITLDGSDPDDDELSWTLDLGDGSAALTGDELPFTVNHTFDEAGNYTISLTVTDGSLSDTIALNITVEADLGEIPDPLTFQSSTTPVPSPLVGSPISDTYCVAQVNARHHNMLSDRGGWIYKLDADEESFSLRWFKGNPQTWIVDDTTAPDNSPLLEYHPTAAPGIVPEGATWVEVCLNSSTVPETGLPYTLRIHHPNHPDAPSI